MDFHSRNTRRDVDATTTVDRPPWWVDALVVRRTAPQVWHCCSTSNRFLAVERVKDTLAITDSTALILVRSGELPAIQVGPKRVWRVEAKELEEFIERQYEATRRRVEGGEV